MDERKNLTLLPVVYIVKKGTSLLIFYTNLTIDCESRQRRDELQNHALLIINSELLI